MQYVGSVIRASVKAHVSKYTSTPHCTLIFAAVSEGLCAITEPGDGVFVTSCVQHEMAWTSADSSQGPFGPTIGGCTHAEAVAAWVTKQLGGGSGGSKTVKQCELVAVDSSDDFATLSKERCNTDVFK